MARHDGAPRRSCQPQPRAGRTYHGSYRTLRSRAPRARPRGRMDLGDFAWPHRRARRGRQAAADLRHRTRHQRAARRDRDRRIAMEVIRNMSEAVTVSDLDFRFVSVNTAFTRMTGYAEHEVLGRD